ncbi:MAG: AMP-binding protein, partial [Candidatus Binatia bacterium]
MAFELPTDFPRTLGELLDRQAAQFPDRPAVSFDGRVTTYAGLRRGADRVAAALVAAGVTKGTRVGLLMPNRPEWLECAFGVAKTGAWLVGLNTLNRRGELAYALRHADVAFVIAVRDFLRSRYDEMFREICAPVLSDGIATNVPALRRVVFHGGEDDQASSFRAFLAGGERVGASELEALQSTILPPDPAAVLFTSGSTATPKAAVLSHAALTYNAWSIAAHLGLTPGDRTWTALPLFFSGG